MKILKFLKKTLLGGAILLSFLNVNLAQENTVHAYDFNDFKKDVNELFESDEGFTFTDYEGSLSTLEAEGYDPSLTQTDDARDFIRLILNFALGFLGIIAVGFIIYAGYLYVINGGDDGLVEKAKNIIIRAGIGIIIILGSAALVNTLVRSTQPEGGSIEGGTIIDGGSPLTKSGFNAAAEQVRAVASDIFNGFEFLAEVTEELKFIQNDIQKDVLKPDSLPSKNDILAFLNSVTAKLENMRSRLDPFSESEAKINDLLRELDQEITFIENLTTTVYIKQPTNGATPLQCDPDEERLLFADVGDGDQEICREKGYPITYVSGLYEKWYELYNKYKDGRPGEAGIGLYDIIDPVSNDYAFKLKENLRRINETYLSFQGIQAIREGRANEAFTLMQSSSAFGFSLNADNTVSSIGGGFLSEIENWSLQSTIDQAGRLLFAGLEQQSIIYEELKTLNFVQARLTANTVEGAAPLTVLFDTRGTEDPAGGSIVGENIIWDLGGTQTTSDIISGEYDCSKLNTAGDCRGEKVLIPSRIAGNLPMTCAFVDPGTETELIGTTSKRCTYNTPGTYTAAVKIKSNDSTRFAPGVSVLTIKVLPPTTKIELEMKAGTNEPVVISHYENDILVTDKQNVRVTLNDAKAGIDFNAEETGAGNQYRWDFGNGDSTDFSNSANVADYQGYTEAGKYEVTLEVLNQLGVTDRKIFTLEIASIAAKIQPSKLKSFVNDTVTFDGSESRSDLGEIIDYQWTIEPSPDQIIPGSLQLELAQTYPAVQSGGTLQEIDHEFKYPLRYDIRLKVTDNGAETHEVTVYNYPIISEDPVALFGFDVPNSAQPSTYEFNGSASYDPDGTDNFNYQWSIKPKSYKILDPENHGLDSDRPIIKFTEKGNYEVSLKVTDQLSPEEFDELTQDIEIQNLLDVALDDDQDITAILNEDNRAEIDFQIESDHAIAYEIDFGDGEEDSGDMRNRTTVTHSYQKSGNYEVEITVYDQEDNDNSLKRRILIGSGDEPLAKAKVFINDEEIRPENGVITANKDDNIVFDASESKNNDGTSRNLEYTWDFGDTKSSSKEIVSHRYRELSPVSQGYYLIKLKVSDEDDPSKFSEDEIRLNITNTPPFFSSIQGVPITINGSITTPVDVEVRAYGVEDPDGDVVKYKWWYFDEDDPEEPLGIQITRSSSARLTIGTLGKEGEEKTYGLGLEITDTDDLKYSNTNLIDLGQYPTITVKNGPNKPPKAEFKVNTTTNFVGDTITFTSSSSDPDGKIISYIWDFEGDGFFNNRPTKRSTVQHTYLDKNLEGYQVRLKVIDDKGGEAVSNVVRINVDSLASDPKAAFRYEVIEGSDGMRIQFYNNSEPDTESGAQIIGYKWDFDVDSVFESSDTDGDGNKGNDNDSTEENPRKLYAEKGNYNVKLTVTDSQGNEDEVINTIQIPLANAPVAAFNYEIIDGKVAFQNNSSADELAGAKIIKYIWDFDTASNLITADTNGDNNKENDQDSNLRAPVHQYPTTGVFTVKLTVIDTQDQISSISKQVEFRLSPTNDFVPPQNDLEAILGTSPSPNVNGIVYLGEDQRIKFDFSKSEGPIAFYQIDKNIYQDSNGDGIKNNDEDFKTVFPGTWTTNFDKDQGDAVAKLTVVDIYGNEDSATIEVKFQ